MPSYNTTTTATTTTTSTTTATTVADFDIASNAVFSSSNTGFGGWLRYMCGLLYEYYMLCWCDTNLSVG